MRLQLILTVAQKAKITKPLADSHPIPAVVLTPGGAVSSVDKALRLIDQFASVDDVYSQSFSGTVVLQIIIGSDLGGFLAQFEASGRFSAVYHTAPSTSSNALPPGPYFLSQDSIHQAYRLYEDELDSFIFGVIPEDVLNPKKWLTPLLFCCSF